MKQIANISIFNDLADLTGPEPTGEHNSSEPMIGNNFEYYVAGKAREIQTRCDELMRQMDDVRVHKKTHKKAIQAKFLDAIDRLDEEMYQLSRRASEETPSLRAAFYDASKAHNSLIHKYHQTYDGFSGNEYAPYMSRDAYINRPMPKTSRVPMHVPGPQYGPGDVDYPVGYGGLMTGQPRLRQTINFPTIPETMLASAAANALVKAHNNFREWYQRACAFERMVNLRQHNGLPVSDKCVNVANLILDAVPVPDVGSPQSDMMELMAGAGQ